MEKPHRTQHTNKDGPNNKKNRKTSANAKKNKATPSVQANTGQIILLAALGLLILGGYYLMTAKTDTTTTTLEKITSTMQWSTTTRLITRPTQATTTTKPEASNKQTTTPPTTLVEMTTTSTTSAATTTTSTSLPPTVTGLVLHLKFDETTGTTAYDSSGGNDGTLINDPVWVAGRDGNSLSFDAKNDYVDISAATNLDIYENITILAWLKPSNLNNNQDVVCKGTQDSGRGYEFGITPAGELRFRINPTASSYAYRTSSGAALAANVWQHVAVTYDGTNIRFYKNGALVSTVAAAGRLYSSAENVYIGTYKTLGTFQYGGRIDELRIYDKRLSGTEINQIHSSVSATTTTKASTTTQTTTSTTQTTTPQTTTTSPTTTTTTSTTTAATTTTTTTEATTSTTETTSDPTTTSSTTTTSQSSTTTTTDSTTTKRTTTTTTKWRWHE